MKALREVGVRRVVRFLWVSVLLSVLRRTWVSPLRVAWLRACGATIGRGSVIQRLTLINVDRAGFGALRIGQDCFIGDEVLIDLAAPVVLEDQVTLAARAVVLTHLNVGYRDHPLQARFPSRTAGVTVQAGAFVGAGATLLPGVTVGRQAFIGAVCLVNRDVGTGEVGVGVPVRTRPSSSGAS